jgi:hypothetical protein
MLIVLSTVAFGIVVVAAYWYRNHNDYHHNGREILK